MYLIKKSAVPIMFLIDLIGTVIFFWRKFRKRPMKIRKVLFIRLEHIGDMIMATPAFETFKKSNLDCKVHVLCKNLTAPLLKNNPYVDKIITYDAPWFNARKEDKKKGFFEVAFELRKEKYDIVFEMHGDPRNNLLAFMARGYSVGYGCRGGGFLLNETKRYHPGIKMIDQNLSLVRDFCKKQVRKTEVYTDAAARKNADKIMKRYGLQKKKFIIINPKSGRREKDLTDDEVMDFIKGVKKDKVVLTGSTAEKEHNQRFVKMNENTIDLSGKTDLLTLVEIVRHARKVIAPDTGIVHIANAVGTECEVTYKTTDRGVWGY